MDVWVISMLSLVMIKKCFAVQLILKKQPSLLGLAPRDYYPEVVLFVQQWRTLYHLCFNAYLSCRKEFKT